MVHDRVANLREKIKRTRKSVEGKRRARERKRRKKKERIEKGQPESLSEETQVAAKEAKGAAGEVKEVGKATKRFLSSELGIEEGKVKDVIASGNAVLDKVEADGDMDALDMDGDGDTDLLAQFEGEGGGMGTTDELAVDPTEPVVDTSTDIDDPLFNEGVSGEVGLSDPVDGEIDF